MNDEPVKCPFCGDEDFDLVGLRLHLMRGWCDVFENLDMRDVIRQVF